MVGGGCKRLHAGKVPSLLGKSVRGAGVQAEESLLAELALRFDWENPLGSRKGSGAQPLKK